MENNEKQETNETNGINENNEKLRTGIGTIESEKKSLEPAKVKIIGVKIVQVGDKKTDKLNCFVKHPDKEEHITLSSVNYLKDKTVVNSGLWFNKDEEKNIQKGSALAIFLESVGAKNINELIGKESDTELEGKYLCFKAY